MDQIKLELNPEANYIFHMLSVAGCGYDNAHGARWRGLYPPEDLAVLKEHETLLTVRGGEHCGELYWLLVCLPARGLHPAEDFYNDLLALFRDGAEVTALSPDAPRWVGRWTPWREAIAALSEVLARAAPRYRAQVWPDARRELEGYAARLRPLLPRELAQRAQALVGQRLAADAFRAVLVNSVDGGATAVDISEDQDVFGIGPPPVETARLICHEFVIFLLKSALADTAAFQDMSAWPLVEGLAEFYTRLLLGEGGQFRAQRRYIEHYRRQLAARPGMDARSLFLSALQTIG